MGFFLKQLLTNHIKKQTTWKYDLLRHWPKIIGDLEPFVSIVKIHNDYIVLGVSDSSWMQELYLLSPVILQTINASLDQPRIKRLRFKQVQKKIVSQTTQEISNNEKKEPLAVHLKEKEANALDKIQDKDLRIALKNFLIRCYREIK